MKRVFGQVGKLKKERVEDYVCLHQNVWAGVLEVIGRYGLHNYSIFIHEYMVFSYFEYKGEDYEKDMAEMEENEVMKGWWINTKPCFEAFAISGESKFYHNMKRIFYYE